MIPILFRLLPQTILNRQLYNNGLRYASQSSQKKVKSSSKASQNSSKKATQSCTLKKTPKVSNTASVKNTLKVTVCGAAGGIGQPLSLMLKQCPLIDELALFDLRNSKAVGLDISHVDTKCRVCPYEGDAELDDALADAKIVLMVAGMPRKEGQTRDDLFLINAQIIQDLADACTRKCPQALIGVITNPVNSLVPVVCEVFKEVGICADARVFGVTILDVVRANTFVAEMLHLPPEEVLVSVIGGHSGKTIVPVLSQTQPRNQFRDAEIQMLTDAIQEAGTVIVKAKAGKGSATLSIAFAAARFTISLAKAIVGQRNVVECAYVRSTLVPDCKYFASPIELGSGGVQKFLGLPTMTEYECDLLGTALPELQKDIKKGEEFILGEAEPPPKEDLGSCDPNHKKKTYCMHGTNCDGKSVSREVKCGE